MVNLGVIIFGLLLSHGGIWMNMLEVQAVPAYPDPNPPQDRSFQPPSSPPPRSNSHGGQYQQQQTSEFGSPSMSTPGFQPQPPSPRFSSPQTMSPSPRSPSPPPFNGNGVHSPPLSPSPSRSSTMTMTSGQQGFGQGQVQPQGYGSSPGGFQDGGALTVEQAQRQVAQARLARDDTIDRLSLKSDEYIRILQESIAFLEKLLNAPPQQPFDPQRLRTEVESLKTELNAVMNRKHKIESLKIAASRAAQSANTQTGQFPSQALQTTNGANGADQEVSRLIDDLLMTSGLAKPSTTSGYNANEPQAQTLGRDPYSSTPQPFVSPRPGGPVNSFNSGGNGDQFGRSPMGVGGSQQPQGTYTSQPRSFDQPPSVRPPTMGSSPDSMQPRGDDWSSGSNRAGTPSSPSSSFHGPADPLSPPFPTPQNGGYGVDGQSSSWNNSPPPPQSKTYSASPSSTSPSVTGPGGRGGQFSAGYPGTSNWSN